MPYYLDNLSWMAFNTILAFVPVVLVVVLRFRLSRFVGALVFLLWLLFLPNTIYLVTDLQHLGAQLLRSEMWEQLILIAQYVTLAVLGVMTYVYSLEPVSTVLKKFALSEFGKNGVYVGIHYVVAFGIILGKVQRTHSWYVFTQPERVVMDVIDTLSDPTLMMWVVIVGTSINILFFLFRDYFPPLKRAHHAYKKKKSKKRLK